MSERVHTTISKEVYNKHRELIEKKYGTLSSVTFYEINRAIENHCKLLEAEIKEKKNQD